MNISTRLAGSVLSLLFANLVLAQEPPTKPPPPVEEVPVMQTSEKDSEWGAEPEVPPDPRDVEEQVFTIVEQMPEFPGGKDALFTYLSKNIKYPEAEREAGIEGKVFISYVVEKDGLVSDVKIMRGVTGGPGLDREAIRVVKTMPKWIPGMQNGRAVTVQMNLPIAFRLSVPVQPPAEK